MPEYRTVIKKIERRTYFKGKFFGKFTGRLDAQKSDLESENFYDLEFSEARVRATKKDFRTWTEGGEFAEYKEIEKFLTMLPANIPTDISDEDDNIKTYVLNIHAPKLTNLVLNRQLYENDLVYCTIEADISGYLVHFDTEEEQVEIPPPAVPDADLEDRPFAKSATAGIFDHHKSNSAMSQGAAHSSARISSENSGGAGLFSALGCAGLQGGGCLTLITTLFICYLVFAVAVMLISAIINLFAGIGNLIFLSILIKIIPVLIIASGFYVFIKLQSKLPVFWKRFLHILLILLIILGWLDR